MGLNVSLIIENLTGFQNDSLIPKQKPFVCYDVDYFYILLVNVILLTVAYKHVPEKIQKIFGFTPTHKVFKELFESDTYVSAAQTIDMIFLLVSLFSSYGWL